LGSIRFCRTPAAGDGPVGIEIEIGIEIETDRDFDVYNAEAEKGIRPRINANKSK